MHIVSVFAKPQASEAGSELTEATTPMVMPRHKAEYHLYLPTLLKEQKLARCILLRLSAGMSMHTRTQRKSEAREGYGYGYVYDKETYVQAGPINDF